MIGGSNKSVSVSGRGLVVAGAVLFGALGAGALLANPDRLLAQSYAVPETATVRVHLDDEGHPTHSGPIARAVDPAPAFAPGAGLPSGVPVVLGARISISTPEGRPRVLEVTAIENIDGERIGMTGARFQMVTCRTVDAGPAAPAVRFLISVEEPTRGKSASLKL